MLVLGLYGAKKVHEMLEREKIDPEYAKKRKAFRDKYGKWWDFGYNLFWWIVSIAFLIWWINHY